MTSKFEAKVAVAVVALYSSAAMSADQMNFTHGTARLSEAVYAVHILMMWIITLIFCAVFGVMFYAVYKHRKSAGHEAAANFHANTMVEIAWTVVPFFILIAMTIPATKTMLEVHDASNAQMSVKVTGHKWTWGYDYPKSKGEGVAFVAKLSTPQEQNYGSEAGTGHSRKPPDRFSRLQ